MPYLYSKSKRCMYVQGIHSKNLPADVVEVTDAQYRELMDGQEQGLEIVNDEKGYPVLREPPKPTAEEVAKATAQ